MFGDDLRIPPGGVLLHVGPHKTGTTAIQGALRIARPTLPDQGVVYAGKSRQHQMAALSVTGGRGLRGDRSPEPYDWDKIVDEAKGLPDKRIIISSEYFDEATDEHAQRIATDLGSDRLHVVVTLRPLAKIMPSAWQQYIRNGFRWSYLDWLDAMLNKEPYVRPTPTFWRRHHHDALVERWVKVLGPDQVAVVALDDSNPQFLNRTFEKFVGLPDGFLVPEEGWDNRSLTAAETEFVRVVNLDYHKRDWAESIYNNVIRLGMILQMQRRKPEPDELSIATPKWAIDRANEINAEAIARIKATGARIVGDIDNLPTVKPKATDADPTPLPFEAAMEAVMGSIIATGIVRRKPPPVPKAVGYPADWEPPRARTIEQYTARELVRVLRKRALRRVRGRTGAARVESEAADSDWRGNSESA